MDEGKVRTALLSVSDKTGLEDFAKSLSAAGVSLISSSGTAAFLRGLGLKVKDVSDVTGFPEIFGGRVKTLHPLIAGGILYRGNEAKDAQELRENGIEGIDLVVVNYYPFEATISKPGVDLSEAVEKIDIGGPTMLRAAAKNYARVASVCDPADYPKVAEEISKAGAVSLETRKLLALKAFSYSASYDATVSNYLRGQFDPETIFPQSLSVPLRLVQSLRYGENPHQKAALYAVAGAEGAMLAGRKQLWGKELSYNNLLDAEAATLLGMEFSGERVAIIIKHNNPCGVALGDSNLEAYEAALACDPVSAFGGVVCFNHEVDAPEAKKMAELFLEIVIAPNFTTAALELLKAKKNLRLLVEPLLLQKQPQGIEFRSVLGGMLAQQHNSLLLVGDLKVATKREPERREVDDLMFAWKVCKHVKSNAIVFARGKRAIGVGAGQMSRVDSVRLACMKARDAKLDTRGCVMASDAYFPFRDAVDEAAKAGITAIIQPGGSIRDEESINAANERNIAMVFTATRQTWH